VIESCPVKAFCIDLNLCFIPHGKVKRKNFRTLQTCLIDPLCLGH